MAAASDKARYYLEQYVPELQEYRQKGIFSREEITSITSKRSDFEHTLNARRSTPADYARYATYEMNLDSLHKKRCKRLGVKSTVFNGQRTVFFVLDRATKKFPADMGLWMQYINFCKKEQANKKLTKVFANVLRLHPRDWSLWVLAAKHYAETQGDMGTARSYLQRGLRFCKDERKMYLEYVKLEMVYLAKLAARRKILGLDDSRRAEDTHEDENYTALPIITAKDVNPEAGIGLEEVNADALKRLENAPALTGAIPIAIFDAAMEQFKKNRTDVAEECFDLVSSFDNVPAMPSILQHISDYLQDTFSTSNEAFICQAKQHFLGVDVQSADFPPALSAALASIKRGLNRIPDDQTSKLAEKATLLLLSFVVNPATKAVVNDEDITMVIRGSIKKYARLIANAPSKPGRRDGLAGIVSGLQKHGRFQEAKTLGGIFKEIGIS